MLLGLPELVACSLIARIVSSSNLEKHWRVLRRRQSPSSDSVKAFYLPMNRISPWQAMCNEKMSGSGVSRRNG